jgi:hypothetical protein
MKRKTKEVYVENRRRRSKCGTRYRWRRTGDAAGIHNLYEQGSINYKDDGIAKMIKPKTKGLQKGC